MGPPSAQESAEKHQWRHSLPTADRTTPTQATGGFPPAPRNRPHCRHQSANRHFTSGAPPSSRTAYLAAQATFGSVRPHPAKHPLTRHGLRDATRAANVVRAWWDRWPWANIGIATGARSGLVVIDVDPASGGTTSLAHLQSLMGSLPETLTASTGGGGQHLVFAHPR